ncbi:MAG: hypothetical protein CVU59_12570 [Deltaproteobacteria bacterium HGW-Deltaproteobacteria-17]|nr:MAG: hypothetical protein CVU59_12570 [Deltaproteobacteria bacterium HGW-Deltaproteobacteria-17]
MRQGRRFLPARLPHRGARGSRRTRAALPLRPARALCPATVAVADRISIAPDGNVLYQLHRPWPKPDSTRTHLTFEPVAFLRRQFLWRCLSALVPSPYQNLIRYHGVFAK